MPRLEVVIAIVALAVGTAIGIGIGYLIWGNQVREVQETFAQPIEHKDGSVTAARVPNEKPRVKAPTTPKGKTTRIVEVEVKPDPVNMPARRIGDVLCPAQIVECKPVRIRLDTTRIDDQTQRVSVKADGGEILEAVDIPVGPTIVFDNKPWAAGYERTPDGVHALTVERDIGSLRLGGTLTLQDQPAAGFRVLMKF